MDTDRWQQYLGVQCNASGPSPASHSIVVVALMTLTTLVISVSARFQSFARILTNQGLRPGLIRYEREGPEELGVIIDAINRYLENQRRSLSKRAMFLSGVSHDLGAATRLRLRAEAIKDKTLSQKINSDIDQMTEMITPVLRYTQSEVNDEQPRQISLISCGGGGRRFSGCETAGYAGGAQHTPSERAYHPLQRG